MTRASRFLTGLVTCFATHAAAGIIDFAALPARAHTSMAGLLAIPDLVALDRPALAAAAAELRVLEAGFAEDPEGVAGGPGDRLSVQVE